MALMRLTEMPVRGESPLVAVEEFVTCTAQFDLAADLDQDGLYGEALVVRATARANKKRGKLAWWESAGTLHPADLPQALWRVWDAMRMQRRKTALVCVY
ncbi:MAG: hypothetical protein OEL20_05040 [Sulfuritalea sp.]|nr:hypothetical protein [Sulfuritalea sp.]